MLASNPPSLLLLSPPPPWTPPPSPPPPAPPLPTAALTRGGAEVASYTLQLQALKNGLGGLDHPHWQDSGGPTAFLTGFSHIVPKPPGGGRFRVRMRSVSTGDAAGEWTESEWSAPSNELTV